MRFCPGLATAVLLRGYSTPKSSRVNGLAPADAPAADYAPGLTRGAGIAGRGRSPFGTKRPRALGHDALSGASPRLPRDLVTMAATPKIIGLLGCAGIPQHAGRSATRTPASARPGEPGFAYRSRRLRRLTRKYFNIEGPSRPGRGAPQDLHVISGRLSTVGASTRTRLYSAPQFGHLNRSA